MTENEINLENIRQKEKEELAEIRKKQKDILKNKYDKMKTQVHSQNNSVTNSTIKGPVGVDKLLGEINRADETTDNSNDDKLLSDSTLNTDTMNSSKKKGRPIKKSNISIST